MRVVSDDARKGGSAIFVDNSLLDGLIKGAILAIAALVWVVILIRINGLRSLSKMSNFDFVMTVALGSLVAGAAQASELPALLQSLAAMVGLFITQYSASRLRKASDTVEDVLDNCPALLMRDGEFDEQAMQSNRVTRSDLIAKLREANVLDLTQVRAVVLETTGDISVLHGEHLDWTLCEGVSGAPAPD